MPLRLNYLNNLKETLLVVTVLYFYTLAIALNFGTPTFGMDEPYVFLAMGALFLIALGLETVLAWWSRRMALFWFVLAVISYGIIGLYVAPTVYGDWIIPYVMLAPLLIVFVAGFAYSYARLLVQGLFRPLKISPEQLAEALDKLPGWRHRHGTMAKEFMFRDFTEALNFFNQAALVIESAHHYPKEMRLHGERLAVVLTSPEEKGVTLSDINLARKLDAL